MLTVGTAMRQAAQQLQAAGIESATLDASLLTAFALGLDRIALLKAENDPMPHDWFMLLRALVEQRCKNIPIAYLTGMKEFYGRTFSVSSAVLIPRPETELLIETALRAITEPRVCALDICTGSGCLAITLKLERPGWQMSANDISANALAVARTNAAQMGADIDWREGDLLAPWGGDAPARFDLIVSNPPYLTTEQWRTSPSIQPEPRLALDGGPDGLDVLRRLIPDAASRLDSGGALMIEIDPSLAQNVTTLFTDAGYLDVKTHLDLAGHARVVTGSR